MQTKFNLRNKNEHTLFFASTHNQADPTDLEILSKIDFSVRGAYNYEEKGFKSFNDAFQLLEKKKNEASKLLESATKSAIQGYKTNLR